MSDIVNPYIAGNPVTGPEMFFGRQDVFQFIRQALMGQHRDNVLVLYGQRRTGKTSVLYQMRSHLDARYLCIFLDMHGFALEGLAGFLWELANHILRVLQRDYQMSLPLPSRSEFMADPRSCFENQLLTHVCSAIGDRHLLLMFDEVVYLQERVQAGKLEPDIFEYIRHLMQHYEWLNFLFSLGSGLEELEKEYAFLFNVALYKKISFLDRQAASELMTQPVKDYYQLSPAALERIYHLTSGHPYYTQLVCHCLFNSWQRQRMACIEARDVDEVLSEALERGSAVLKYSWEELTPSEKAIIAGMATAMGQDTDAVDARDLHRAWRHGSIVISEGQRAKAIRSLLACDVIVGQAKYAFTVELQRVWVQKYRRMEWVKEEIADLPLEKPKSRPLPWPPPPATVRLLLMVMVFVLLGGSGLLFYANSYLPYQQHAHAIATAQAATQVSDAAAAAPERIYERATSGHPVLNDPLNRSGGAGRWPKLTQAAGSCAFRGGAYHVTAGGGQEMVCPGGPSFRNFIVEVQMTVLKGDCGGILFRADNATGHGYEFEACSSGDWGIYLNSGLNEDAYKTLQAGNSSAVQAGLNSNNLVAVAAINQDIHLYVNRQSVYSLRDQSYSLGQIGFVADDSSGASQSNASTEVVYKYLKVWTF